MTLTLTHYTLMYVGPASPDKPGSPLPLEGCLSSTFRNHIHFEGEFLENGLPWWVGDKESACIAGDLSSVPGSGRSPGEGNGNHSSTLAWRIPWTEEPRCWGVGVGYIQWDHKELGMIE